MKSDDRLLFLGNPQQSVPKRLLLARNLSHVISSRGNCCACTPATTAAASSRHTTTCRAGSQTSLKVRWPRAVPSATR